MDFDEIKVILDDSLDECEYSWLKENASEQGLHGLSLVNPNTVLMSYEGDKSDTNEILGSIARLMDSIGACENLVEISFKKIYNVRQMIDE